MTQKRFKKLNQLHWPKHLFHGPEWLVLGVNNFCNLHCKMCDVGTQSNETVFATNLIGTNPMDMPLELFERIVLQTAKHYPRAKLGYAFTEPLIYKHLDNSLSLAQEYNLTTAITTNGMMLKQKADIIVDTCVSDIFLSLDGIGAIHNEIRGHNNSFEKAMDGLETLLARANPPRVSIFCVITEWNYDHLKEVIEFFSAYPLEQIGFMHTNFTPENIAIKHNDMYGALYPATHSNIEESAVENIDLDKLWQEILAIKHLETSYPINFSPEISSLEALKVFYQQPEIFVGQRCHDVFSNIMIKSDGSVIPAHGRCYNLDIGNLYEQDITEIWNSAAISKFRYDISSAGGLFPACSRCCSAFS